ncbi:MAG: FHA domain-containing protein, partial [Planctomycetota bacterium]
MLTTSYPHSQVTQKSGEFRLQVSLAPLTQEVPPVELTTGEYKVGSGSECPIRIEVPGIAKEHCTLVVGEHEVSIRAIDPRVWVNDRPVRNYALTAGMKFFVGPIGFLVDSITKVPLEAKPAQPQIETAPIARNRIEIPEELQAMAKFQRVLEERQKLLEKIELEQVELQREMELQEAELARLHQRFSLESAQTKTGKPESREIPETQKTQHSFDDAILELDQKLTQLDLLKQEVSQEQAQLLSEQNEVRGQRQRLIQLEESLRGEQAALIQQQRNLTDAWHDLEVQQANEQAERDAERAFLELLQTQQEKRQQEVTLSEQSFQSYEQELSEERNRLESWAEDLETQQDSLRDQADSLEILQQSLAAKQKSSADQDQLLQELEQQREQLQQELDQLEAARNQLAD